MPPDAAGLEALSPREREVAALVLAGKPNTAIARLTLPQPQDHRGHTRNIYAKLGVSSRAALATVIATTTRPTPVDERL